MSVRVLTGDCREVLATLPEEHFDACVTDPPYHLTTGKKGGSGDASVNLDSPYGRSRVTTGFMNQTWDGGDLAFTPDLWLAVYRVLKPGAYLLAFGGTRTHHRMACAIEDAGFEIRDEIMWIYGSGFPKSRNGEWGGTALKPSVEPITMARKPLEGTVEANWRKWGTGALNIDGCRVDAESGRPLRVGDYKQTDNSTYAGRMDGSLQGGSKAAGETTEGRWPANLIHDGSEEVVAAFPAKAGQSGSVRGTEPSECHSGVYSGPRGRQPFAARGDSGSASRFFYAAKASKAERGAANNHPTVKPLALMQYLCRLVTPKGGAVLDPFAGSGTTGVAADREGFNATLIERDEAYAEMARARLAKDGGLFADLAGG